MATVTEPARLRPVASPRREVRLDAGRHPRGRIGFVLLETEETVEDDVRRVMPADVGVFFTRAAIPVATTVETLGAMAPGIGAAAGLLPPGLDATCYACTSGSVVIGEARVERELSAGQPGARPMALVTCVTDALARLGVRRLALATPYLDDINTLERDFLEAKGFEVVHVEGLNLESGTDMMRVAPGYIADFALEVDRPEAEAIFVSCTGLRSLDVVDEIERRAGKPVLTSNQAMIWRLLRLVGVDDRIDGFGSLLREH